MNWLWAALICAAAAGFEGLCAGRDPLRQLEAVKQPRWSPPGWAWVLVGIAWYGICFTGLARLLPVWPEAMLAILLLVALLFANGAANVPLFRMRRLDLALAFFAPYWALLAAFMLAARPHDPPTFIMFAVYCLYQLYALAWGVELWRLNRASA